MSDYPRASRRQPAPAMQLDPIVRTVDVDARIRVAVDVRRLCTIDAATGEPSDDELQAYVLALITCYLKVQPWIGDVRVGFIDVAQGLVTDLEG